VVVAQFKEMYEKEEIELKLPQIESTQKRMLELDTFNLLKQDLNR